MIRVGLVASCLFVSTIAAAATKYENGYHASMQIVIDSSASMGSSGGDKPLARRVVEEALKAVEAEGALPAQVDISWRVFGGADGSEDSKCEATELLSPPGVTPGPVLRAALPRISARGPRPLSTAVEAAAGDLPHAGSQKSVLVITSGGDNCGRDICLTANELRESVGLGHVRVLLINGDPSTAAHLACLGKVSVVKSVDGVGKAVTESVEALLTPAEVTVVASEQGHDVPAQVEFFAGNDKQPSVRAKAGEGTHLAAGIYQIHVVKALSTDDDAPRSPEQNAEGFRQNVEFTAGAQLAVRIPLGGQRAKLTANVLLNGQPPPAGTRVAVFHAGDTEEAVAGGAPGEPIQLPPGRYDVRAEIPGGPSGTIEVWKPEVNVLPGSGQTITLAATQKRGSLRVVVQSAGDPVGDAQVALVPAGSTPGGQPLFQAGSVLPAPVGTFTVVAQVDTPIGPIRTKQEGVKISSNQLTDLSLDIGPSARLTVQVTGKSESDGIVVMLIRGGQIEPAGSLDAFSTQRLLPGRYDLRLEDPNGGKPRVYWYRHLDLKAGDNRTVTVTPP